MFFNFKAFLREFRFIFKQTHIVGILIAALLLSVFAIWSGLEEVEQQNQTIDRLIAADKIDRESEQKKQSDYGSAAYYSFHLTYDRPSNLAFAALGDRDSRPCQMASQIIQPGPNGDIVGSVSVKFSGDIFG